MWSPTKNTGKNDKSFDSVLVALWDKVVQLNVNRNVIIFRVHVPI